MDLEQEKQEKLQNILEGQDLKKVLETNEGKKVIAKIFDFCGLFRNAYAGDAQQTSYNCGMQAVGQWLLDECLEANKPAVSQIIFKNNLNTK